MNKLFIAGIVFIAALIVTGISVSLYAAYGTQEEVTFVVKDKERICEGSDQGTDCRYLVFTDIEVFENTDTVLNVKFNSSDIQGHLTEGQEYTVTVVGWRIPFFSMYRNIIEVENGH